MDTHRNRPAGTRSAPHPPPPAAAVAASSTAGSAAPTTDDVKAYLMATESGSGVAGKTVCSADNMPAHFKHRSELSPTPLPPSSSPSSSSPSSPSLSSAADVASAVVASTTSSFCSSSSITTVSSPQSLVIVPGSPPQSTRAPHDNVLPAAIPSRLARLRQNNLAKKREQMKTMKMPELSEHAESADSEPPPPLSNGGPPPQPPTAPSSDGDPAPTPNSPPAMPAHGAGDSDACGRGGEGGGGGERVVRPPSPSADPVSPSLPESFLKQLGLSTARQAEAAVLVNGGQQAVEQLPDKQLESRFNSLALAFKTDRLTLDKRLGIQERSRDIAEQNIDKELQGLREAVETLNQLWADERVQEVISKIQHHLDILEHSVARVSSRAEVFGAVQQEKRMCLAMEVMITYTENIRRLRSTEQSEVEEARRILNSSRQIGSGFSLDTLSIGDRRSASVCAALNNPRTARRRSEVALPRFFGGVGSPSLHVSSSMEPRQRFQSATANVTVRNVVTNTLRRASLERQKNLSLHSSSSSTASSLSTSVTASDPPASRSESTEQSQEQASKQHSQEEEAYRHGYEEGLKASLSRELTELRDQQTSISSNLEQVMDRVEAFQEDDKDSSDIEEAVSKVKEAVVKVRLWMSNPNWTSASQTLRKVAAGLIFLLALVVVVVTFAPLIPANISIRNYAKSTQ